MSTQDPAPFTLLGDEQAAVCADGVCAVPGRDPADEEPTPTR